MCIGMHPVYFLHFVGVFLSKEVGGKCSGGPAFSSGETFAHPFLFGDGTYQSAHQHLH